MQDITVESKDLQKLLAAASPDVALLYLYLRSGADPALAEGALHITQSRLSCAGATLRQLGLWQPEEKKYIAGQRPNYSEQDVLQAMDQDRDFRGLYGELQRLLGRNLNTEEMKIILGFVRYLALPPGGRTFTS